MLISSCFIFVSVTVSKIHSSLITQIIYNNPVQSTSIIWTKWSTGVFGLSNRPGFWISYKQLEFFSKIIYSKDLVVHFVHKQPKIGKILYLFNVAINHVIGYIPSTREPGPLTYYTMFHNNSFLLRVSTVIWLNGRAVAQRLDAGFPPRRPGFAYGQHVGFVVDKAALGQVF
jgi:hypothetical protein